MDKKDIKQLLDQQTEDMQKHVEDHLTKQTKELHQDYNHQGKFLLDEFKHQTSVIAEQHTDLKKEIKGVKQITNSTFEEVGRLRVNVEIIKQDVEFIKSSLKRKVDIEEFAALEKRVLLLEKKY